MKSRLFLLLLLFSPLALMAQQEDTDSLYLDDAQEDVPYPTYTEPLFHVFTPSSVLSPVPTSYYWDMWSLHEGLNARISLGASAGFGKGSPKGVGLEEHIDVAYAGKWKNRWTYAFMIQGTNATWGPVRSRDISLSGFVGYRASERLSLYAYISKSILHDNNGFVGLYSPIGQPSVERVGFVADWVIGDNAWLQVVVEASRVKFDNPWPFCNVHDLYGPPPMRPLSW